MTTGEPIVETCDGEREKIRALPWALSSSVLNSFFSLWTFGGSVFVLFLNELGLPKGRIGVVLSLFPFCGLLALGFAPVAARLGRKRVFLWGYGLRKPVMALLLLLPWVTTRFGLAAAIGFLGAVIVVFAVLRALAETAVYPWMQEFIPNRVRGRYAAWSAVFGLIASGGALGIAGKVLAASGGLTGYMWLIGAGTLLGLTGVLMHAKVPGCALTLLAPLGWLLLPVSSPNIILASAVLYFVTGVAANGVAIGAGRLPHHPNRRQKFSQPDRATLIEEAKESSMTRYLSGKRHPGWDWPFTADRSVVTNNKEVRA